MDKFYVVIFSDSDLDDVWEFLTEETAFAFSSGLATASGMLGDSLSSYVLPKEQEEMEDWWDENKKSKINNEIKSRIKEGKVVKY